MGEAAYNYAVRSKTSADENLYIQSTRWDLFYHRILRTVTQINHDDNEKISNSYLDNEARDQSSRRQLSDPV